MDDELDAYYHDYLSGFAPDRPYVSVIFSERNGNEHASARGWIAGEEFIGEVFRIADSSHTRRIFCRARDSEEAANKSGHISRLISMYGSAAEDLRNATVGVVRLGGTGSAATEVLARANVRNLILVDHETFEEANLEKVHGSKDGDLALCMTLNKAEIAARHVAEIDPSINVVPIVGNCLQRLSRDWLVQCDLILGCTDSSSGRVALSELSYRYLVPIVDIGVLPEQGDGKVTAQANQVCFYIAGRPCVHCRDLIEPWQVSLELMSPAEVAARQAAADAARARDELPDPYWRRSNPLLSVGHLTTVAGGLAAGYAIGLLTGKCGPPAEFFQFDTLAKDFGYVSAKVNPRPECACQKYIGWADQAGFASVINPPSHWPDAKVLAKL